MKKIVPFNNVLEFNTDVKEITAISLEHEISKSPDMINGIFYISGEYKITEGLLDKEKFNFELPFDIALSNSYKIDSLLVDIDDFRYDLVSDKSLKVNIDLYIDGEIEEPIPIIHDEESLAFLDREELEEAPESESIEEPIELSSTEKINEIISMNEEAECKDEESLLEDECTDEPTEVERIDLLKEMLTDTKEENMQENTNTNENNNINIFENTQEETYVTYRVYKVEENDNIDTILTKYNITKEQLADYNNIENITPGDKLIIPTNEK